MNEKTIVIFENISSDDFTGKWNSIPYTVKAGETQKLPQYLARHLAKHLATRELGATVMDKDPNKLAFIDSCIHDLSIDTPRDETEMLVAQHKDEPELEPEMEEFEELNEKTNEDTSKKSNTKGRTTKTTRSKRG
jgi:hypothetical protein